MAGLSAKFPREYEIMQARKGRELLKERSDVFVTVGFVTKDNRFQSFRVNAERLALMLLEVEAKEVSSVA